MKIELRNTMSELRATGTESDMHVAGRALSYGVLSAMHVPAYGARERIARGAFSRSIARNDQVVASFNHDSSLPLGRRSAGNLDIDDDEDGLYFDCRLNPEISYHRDLWHNVKDGTIQSNSFEFSLD